MYVDPVTQLGLNTDSVMGYSIGDINRTSDAETPELLPCGYLVGESDTISVTLKGTFFAYLEEYVLSQCLGCVLKFCVGMFDHKEVLYPPKY